MSEVNRASLVHFLEVIETTDFHAHFNFWQAPCEAVFKIDHVLKYRSYKENCGCDEVHGERTFEAFKANDAHKLLRSQYSRDRHRKCFGTYHENLSLL